MKINLLFGLVLLAMQSVSAETISIERIFQSPSLDGSAPKKLKLSPDGKYVTYIKGKDSDFERYDLWAYELASGENRLLFNADDLHTGNEALSDEEKARRERMRVFGSGIIDYHWSSDATALLFPLAGDAYYAKLSDIQAGDKKAKRLLNTSAFETDLRFSPKGNYISFIRNQNLYALNILTGKEKAITSEGGGNIKFGMAEFIAQEEMSRMTGYWWSPDERQIAFTKVDESPVEEITRSEIYADSIKVITQRYPSTGTSNVKIELGVANIESGNTQWVDMGEEEDRYLTRAKWMNDKVLSYQWQSRDQKTLMLQSFDTSTKQQKTLVTEKDQTWLNLHKDLRFLKASEQFVWASERDGFKHLYLYSNSGKLIRQLTQGKWVVNELVAIDEGRGLLYFTGRKDSPTEKYLYSVQINDEQNNIKRISKRDGYHSITASKDSTIYVDKYSTINSPPQVSLHKMNGDHITWLSENKVDKKHPLAAYQESWVEPEFGTIKAEDGTDLYYRIYKPKRLKGKHPVVVYTYGGPIAQVVTNRWAGNRGLLFQHLANKGYVVFSLDNRGSNYRGKAFENPIYQAMGDVEVRDQVTGVKFLRTLDFVDAERIGVYGHSYGGYMALMTMFKAGDYFKAGVSGAPVTDWLLYDTHYTERYMGHPNQVPDAYEASSVFPYAKDLKGPLLIYHGMADDNVLFKHSTKLYKHLQDEAIQFEVMDYPGKKHSIRGKKTGTHLYSTIVSFFDRHFDM